ncbi:Uncharacterized protein BP5553_10255 [Venustampulla echinocandica]|uniref:Uncharacterized protein n=1 Tax=Venustampulla echinocandica TaxID=2656787 RepID=A0A370T9N9_9HELO|nr:Uncharacterized protein BP5553_10255 [Venustampulla echinocandica]RDL30377.1 Uncharacterized protein BP5553_10255 [Venustampulla echinocandica]
MAVANAAINIIVLGVSGLLSIPALTNFFAKPEPEKITVNIGIGATNSSVAVPGGSNGPGGNTPHVELYDVNGHSMGRAVSDVVVVDGGTVGVTISGQEGSVASETPVYISLEAGGSDEVCISWFTTTSGSSDGADFRSWNGVTAKACNLPWYPSTAAFPGVSVPFQPPCFWMSNDGRFVDAFSARLTDFFFPGSSGPANATATQWSKFPETLCHAPGRQQFYKNPGVCIPFYPSGLAAVNQKDPNTGFDVDFNAIQSSFTQTCSIAGIPFNCEVDLARGVEGANHGCTATNGIIDDPDLTLPASITSQLKSSLVFNLGPPPSPPVDGAGAFGGVVGTITADTPPPQTSDGVGAFGGVVGTIAADTPPPQTSIGVGAFGGVVGQIPARARRAADRASILQRRANADMETLLTVNSEQPAITAAPTMPPKKQRKQRAAPAPAPMPKPVVKRHAPVLDRHVEKRAEQPHRWCQEGQLVISEHSGHSAAEVCESKTSWGPDFISVVEGIYCDMCERRSYPLCNNKVVRAGGGSANGTCFHMESKQLRATSGRHSERSVPVKRYHNVRYWK